MTSPASIQELGRLLKVRLEEWRRQEEPSPDRSKPVITITREPGSGAKSIAERLCSELGFHLYDWEVVERIAKDEDVSAQLVSALEQKPPGEFKEWLTELHAELQGQDRLSSQAYVSSLKRVLFAIAVAGNAVVVGRGSSFFLPTDKRIALCFVAPLAVRIKATMNELGVTEGAARKHISKLEGEHRKLVKKHFAADIRDPAHYHLVINTALVRPDTIVQLVKTLIQTIQPEKGEQP